MGTVLSLSPEKPSPYVHRRSLVCRDENFPTSLLDEETIWRVDSQRHNSRRKSATSNVYLQHQERNCPSQILSSKNNNILHQNALPNNAQCAFCRPDRKSYAGPVKATVTNGVYQNQQVRVCCLGLYV